MADIGQSVGAGGVNNRADIVIVQKLLNLHIVTLGLPALTTEGNIGPKTIAAIKRFQTVILGVPDPNGRADPGGRTITALNAPPGGQLSGAAWWHANQGLYPNSASLSDLAPDFEDKAKRFIAAMRAGGASVSVTSTRRNKIRAYLMHYSWTISSGKIAPADVPAEPGCMIIWDHHDAERSRKAAQDMRDLFGLVHEPSLKSRHIEGKAVDMVIGWTGTIKVRDAAGKQVTLSTPANGSNPVLHKIGASYGVIKLLSDPPHWSSDGA
jgi:hypothetical protein